MAKQKSEERDLLAQALEDFKRAEDAEQDNRATYRSDSRFVLEEDQWPANLRKQREDEGRPVLTINKLRVFCNQVINDARQNKPQPKVHPVDSAADVETADIYNGLIRNIEYTSSADVAYDTAIACAVTGGFGYWRFGLDYAYDDTFDMDIKIMRVPNPLSVYADPNSVDADSCNWDVAFVADWLSNDQFEAQYGDKAKVDWSSETAWKDAQAWRSNDGVMVAEWWTRKPVDRPIVLLADALNPDDTQILDTAVLKGDPDLLALVSAGKLKVIGERTAKSYQVTQRIMSGVEILNERKWPGKYIPIVPVYGDEFNIDGKRYLRSLAHGSLDAQRSFNFWRTVAAEVAAYTPRVPFIGRAGAFATDPNWALANTKSFPYLEYDGNEAPQRQPMDMGTAAGALQEALNASDDIKATIGMFDASIGARSNETSGKAINARKVEGEGATFHFTDNLSRAIRHSGRIMIDLIPKVFSKKRIVRIIGEDGEHSTQQLGTPVPVTDKDGAPQMDQNGAPMMRVYDLDAGKYDLTVSAGPSYQTRREEAAVGMTEAIRAFPEAAPVILPRLAKNSDWPEADDIAADLEKLSPLNQAQIPPEVQQQMDQAGQQIDQLTQENQQLKQDQSAATAKVQSDEKIKLIQLQSNAQIEREKMLSDEKIAQERIASDERIAMAKAASDARIASERAAQMAKATPKPNGAVNA